MQPPIEPAYLADYRILGDPVDRFKIGGDGVPPAETLDAYTTEINQRTKLIYHPRVHPVAAWVMAHNLACLVHKIRTSEMEAADVEDLLDTFIAPMLRGVTAWTSAAVDQSGPEAQLIDHAFAGIVAVVKDMATRA